MASVRLAEASPESVVTLTQSLSARLLLPSLFAECCKVVGATACVALLPICQALGRGMGITTFVAVCVG